ATAPRTRRECPAARRRALLVGHDRRAARADLRGRRRVKFRPRVPQSPWTRAGIAVIFLCGVGGLLWLHGPHWSDFRDAFSSARWEFVAAAVGLTRLSTVGRAGAWDTVIKSSMPAPPPTPPLVFSAFCVGLLANAVLPGRVGELARVGVLTRRLNNQGRPG